MNNGIDQFFAYARERYSILLKRRAGAIWPWTQDPILQKYRFCNVFREDDVVTRWVEANLRKPLRESKAPLSRVLLVLTVARFINRVSALEHLAPVLLEKGWALPECAVILEDLKPPIVTGAYMIRTPHGMSKIAGLNLIFNYVQVKLPMYRYELAEFTNLAQFHACLMRMPYMGSFMAYEVVTDLRWVCPEKAEDRLLWANAGPGAARGLSRVFHGELGHYRNTPGQQPKMCGLMWNLQQQTNVDSNLWPADWPSWEMRDVEHTLCEHDKYERARLGEGEPKQLYRYEQSNGS